MNRTPAEFRTKPPILASQCFQIRATRAASFFGENVNQKKPADASRKWQLVLLFSSILHQIKMKVNRFHTISRKMETQRFFHICLTAFARLQLHPNFVLDSGLCLQHPCLAVLGFHGCPSGRTFSALPAPPWVQTLLTKDCVALHNIQSESKWAKKLHRCSVHSWRLAYFGRIGNHIHFIHFIFISDMFIFLWRFFVPIQNMLAHSSFRCSADTKGCDGITYLWRKQRKNWICQSCNQCPLTSPEWRSC